MTVENLKRLEKHYLKTNQTERLKEIQAKLAIRNPKKTIKK